MNMLFFISLFFARTRYSEKNVGYIAVSLLLRSGDHMMTLVINSIRNDLNSHSSPAQVPSRRRPSNEKRRRSVDYLEIFVL